MPTTLQFRRGNTVTNNNFTGANGEITVNFSNNSIRVHNGSTLGGTELATLGFSANATNFITGTIPAARLPTSGVVAATYGSATGQMPQIVVDSTGRITSASNITVVDTVTNTAPIGAVTTNGDVALTHLNSGVAAATYGNATLIPVITVNATGHVTNVSNVVLSAGGGSTLGFINARAFFLGTMG